MLSAIAFLELKQTMGTARPKVRLTSVADAAATAHRAARAARPGVRGVSLVCAREMEQELAIESMAPRLTTWYRRAAMTAETGRLRITLDERLTFCRPQNVVASAPRSRQPRTTSSRLDPRGSSRSSTGAIGPSGWPGR